MLKPTKLILAFAIAINSIGEGYVKIKKLQSNSKINLHVHEICTPKFFLAQSSMLGTFC